MKLCVIAAAFLLAILPASARSQAPEQCPPNTVCITREAAVKALQDSDTVEAQKKQIAVLDQAILDLKAEIVKAQIELAKVVGEKTGLEKNAIRDAAIIEMLLQNVKKKRNAFITLF